MSRETIVVFKDDLDGSETPDVAPLNFSFEGVDYVIDLREANKERLRSLLEPYINAGVRLRGARPGIRSYLPRTRVRAIRALDRQSAQEEREERARIREVLLANDVPVKPRGYISDKHRRMYERIVAGKSPD